MTVQELAKDYSRHFKAGERKSEDTGEMIRILDDDAPAELIELVHEAHGDYLPDDIRYDMIEDALHAIAEVDYLDDAQSEFADGGSVYTADHLRWLSSRLDRMSYCDEFVNEFGLIDADMNRRITGGIYMERQEVFSSVLASLEHEVD